jgi:hypothetical protein
MASISEIQGYIRAANKNVVEAMLLASEAVEKAEIAKQLYTRITQEDNTSNLLMDCQVGISAMIAGCNQVIQNAGVVTEKGDRFSAILSS